MCNNVDKVQHDEQRFINGIKYTNDDGKKTKRKQKVHSIFVMQPMVTKQVILKENENTHREIEISTRP